MTISLTNPELLRERAYINGEWVQGRSGDLLPVTNPANGEHLADVPDMGADDTRQAIQAAEAAWPPAVRWWSSRRRIPGVCAGAGGAGGGGRCSARDYQHCDLFKRPGARGG